MKRLGLVVSVLVVALVGSLLTRVAIVESEDPLVVVHWSNSHPLREDLLLRMADQFNDATHETPSGQPIEIRVVSCDSAVQADDLVARATGGSGDHECEVEGERADDPTIVTPQSDDWLVNINHYAERDVIDLDQARGAAIAKAYLGIVTFSEMADCLRDSRGEVGYADIVELADKGWGEFVADGGTTVEEAACPRPSWGDPLLTFTNPSTSTSGRNVLVTLYSIAAGDTSGIKPPSQLELADVTRPEVAASVEEFQALVDAYMPSTSAMNRRIADSSETDGHFFLMPEDNLVSLLEGNETVQNPDGSERPVDVTGLEMIYPKEGSVLNSNPTAVVDASWVSGDELDAAHRWIDHLREDEQQRAFMAAGFRPGTDLAIDADQFERWGLDAEPPATEIDPGQLDPEVLEQIIGSWGAVKKPSVVTFVVDVSRSMENSGAIEPVREGLRDILDEMQLTGAASSQIGLVTFNDEVQVTIPPARLTDVGSEIGNAITEMEGDGETALYDALRLAIQYTDRAAALDDATRAVVVLSDGADNRGEGCLDDIVEIGAVDDVHEGDVAYCAKYDEEDLSLAVPHAQNGDQVAADDVIGLGLDSGLNVENDDLKVFFLGFGTADPNVGRILAGATKADFQASPDEGLAAVILALSGYF